MLPLRQGSLENDLNCEGQRKFVSSYDRWITSESKIVGAQNFHLLTYCDFTVKCSLFSKKHAKIQKYVA